MDILVSIHAQVEEFLIKLVGNVFVQLEIGMEELVSFAQILKYGQHLNYHVFVQTVIGMVKLA